MGVYAQSRPQTIRTKIAKSFVTPKPLNYGYSSRVVVNYVGFSFRQLSSSLLCYRSVPSKAFYQPSIELIQIVKPCSENGGEAVYNCLKSFLGEDGGPNELQQKSFLVLWPRISFRSHHIAT